MAEWILLVSLPSTFLREDSFKPNKERIAGATNTLNITSEDTGFPGSPITSFSPITPNIVGLPG